MPIRLAPSALALVAGLILPGPAAADCQPVGSTREALAAADVAFVGTAQAVADGGSRATFRVDETWAGSLGPTLEVRGLSDGAPGEDDRTFQAGQTYLVIPVLDGGVVRDHICTGTTPWRADLAVLRPAGVATAGAAASGDGLLPFLALLAALTVAAAGAILLIGRRHPVARPE